MTGSLSKAAMEQQQNNHSIEMNNSFKFELESLCGFKVVDNLWNDTRMLSNFPHMAIK